MESQRWMSAQENGIDLVSALALREALEHLTPRQRRVIVLRYVDDLTMGEIARREGVAVGTVRDTLIRAQGRLRRWLEQP